MVEVAMLLWVVAKVRESARSGKHNGNYDEDNTVQWNHHCITMDPKTVILQKSEESTQDAFLDKTETKLLVSGS